MEQDRLPETILQEALEIANPSERAAYLDRACGADGALREEIESLLGAYLESDTFMSPIADQVWEYQSTERVGNRVGRYSLVEKIAEGGFGVVFRAEQQEPVKRVVALKVIKPGMDSKEVISRFELERQALAVMDHPNIAKVYDAGTTEQGRPFFAMELVDGVPLTQYCDDHRLNIPERLKLFAQICLAIQHAHQKGIIHRDLKPNNILVGKSDDGSSFPKVIDFGVAKAISPELTPDTMITVQGLMMGTPRYMSPEQAGSTGADIDTRSDIYSLGVILYELMTGRAPLCGKKMSSANFDEVRQMICNEEPGRPSDCVHNLARKERCEAASARRTEEGKLRRHLKGDLDWIMMKALEKDRERRYDTAQGLAVDVRSYLSGRPVGAGPPGTAYRVGKFVRRNRWPVAVFALGMLTLITLLVAVFYAIKSESKSLRKDVADGEKEKVERVVALALNIEKVKSMRTDGSGGSREKALPLLGAVGRFPREEIDEILGRSKREKLIESARNELIACLMWTDLKERPLLKDSGVKRPMAALDPDHRNCALDRGKGRIEVLDSATGAVKKKLLDDRKRDLTGPLRFNPKGDFVAIGFREAGESEENHWKLALWNWNKETSKGKELPGVFDAFDFDPTNSGFVMGTRKKSQEEGNGWEVSFFNLDGIEHGERIDLRERIPVVMRFSPDGSLLAIGFRDPGIIIVDLETKEHASIGKDLHISSLAWNPDGNLLLAGDDQGGVTALDKNSGTIIFEAGEKHSLPVDQVAWSHDGLLIASGSRDDVIHLRDSRLGDLLCKSKALARTLSFSLDDHALGPVSPVHDPKALSSLEVQRSPACYRTVGHSAASIEAAVWYDDSTFLATGASDGVRMWNRKGEQLNHFSDDLVHPGGLACSETHLFLAENDGIWSRTIEISEGVLQFGEKTKFDGNVAEGRSLLRHGEILAVSCNEEVVLLDWKKKSILKRLPVKAKPGSLSFSPDSRWLAAGYLQSPNVRVWDLTSENGTWKDLKVESGATVSFYPLAKNEEEKSISTYLMTGDAERYIQWRFVDESGEFEEVKSVPNKMDGSVKAIPHIAYSPRGTALAVSIKRKYLQILDPDNFQVMMQPGFEEQWPLTISPDGRLLTTEAPDGRLYIWNFAEAREELEKQSLDWEKLSKFQMDRIPIIRPQRR